MWPNWRSGSLPDVGVLIPAGGRGERAGGGEPKQFRLLAGQPVLLRSIRPFASHPDVGQIVVALPAEVAANPPGWLREAAGDRVRLVAGGATRATSVREALRALAPGHGVVLVHDAARPMVTREEIDAVIAGARAGEGAVPAVPVADTLKRALDDGRVVETPTRVGLWRALTPQGFPRPVLEAAFARAETLGELGATDDAAMVEALGTTVRLVPGSHRNIKLTTPDDFALVEAWLR